MDDLTFNKPIRLFPNPFADEISINWDGLNGASFSARLYDLQGRLVLSRNFNTATAQIGLASLQLSNGVYLLKLRSDKGEELTQKLVKM